VISVLWTRQLSETLLGVRSNVKKRAPQPLRSILFSNDRTIACQPPPSY
jgi:hypothetical protein